MLSARAQAEANGGRRPSGGRKDRKRAVQSLVGYTIAGYEIQRELGHGAMGVVYKALEKSLNRTIALKILSPKLARNESDIQGFYKEARAAAKITHPNVVTIFTVGSEEPHHYIAMEFVQGRTLSRMIHRAGRLKVKESLEIVREVADALEAAHRHKILHRDIKPQNIMIDDNGRPRVMDFGIARMRESGGHNVDTNEWIGTPAYLSPEQCLGKTTDNRSDIYALGVVLFEMLAGRTPYVLSDRAMLKKMIIESPVPSIRRFNKEVPYSVVRILEKALAKDPAQRYASCYEMKEDLERVLASRDLLSGQSESANEITATSGATLRSNPPTPPSTAPTPLPPVGGERGRMGASLKVARPATDAETPIRPRQDPAPEPYISPPRRPLSLQPKRLAAIAAAVAAPVALAIMAILRAQSGELARYVGHRGDVYSAAVSPDGKWIVSGAEDFTVRVWPAAAPSIPVLDFFWTPRVRSDAALSDHGAEVHSVAYAPDGKTFLSGGSDHLVRLWDAKTRKAIRQFEGHQDYVASLAYSPDSKLALSGGADGAAVLWDLESGRALARLKGHTAIVKGVAFSPDGRLMATGSGDKTIRIWDARDHSLARKLEGHEDTVASVAFSPDGSRLLSAGWDRTIRLWEAATGKPLRVIRAHEADIWCARFSPDGKTILSGGWDGALRVWSVADGLEIARLDSAKANILDAQFTPDGRAAIGAGARGTLRMWKLPPEPAQTQPAKKEAAQ